MSRFHEGDDAESYDPRTAPPAAPPFAPDGAPAPSYGTDQGYGAGPAAAYPPPTGQEYGYVPTGPGAGPAAPGYGYGAGSATGYPPPAGTDGGPAYGYAVRAGDPHSASAYDGSGANGGYGGHGYAYDPHGDGGTYVPEPMSGQMPSEVEPGAGYGVPTAGDAWGGHAPAGGPHGAPAAGGWGGPPASAHPWGGAPEAAYTAEPQPGYAPGTEAGHGPGFGHAAGPRAGFAHGHHAGFAPTGPAAGPAAGYPPAEPVVEQTVPFPVVGSTTPAGTSPQSPTPPHRTGSPIIPPGIQPAGLTALLGLLMAGGAAVGRPGLAVVLVILEAVTAAGWFRLNGMWPARQGIVLAFLAGVTADIAVLGVQGSHGPVALLGTLGVWLLLVLVLQLRHHGSADERLSSLTATSASTLLTVVAAGWLAAATSHAGTDPVVVGAVAVAAATLVRAVRLPGGEPISLLTAAAAAAVTGLLTGPATDFGSGHAALLGAACGLCALIGLRVASYDWPSRFVHFTAGVALPLTAAAPAVYAVGALLS